MTTALASEPIGFTKLSMQFIRDNKMYIAGILLVVMGLWIYMAYFSGSSSDATLTSDQSVSPLSPDILLTLSKLHTITLDSSIFTDPIFLSLSDYGVAIPPQNAGRRNPFAPI